LERVGRPIQDLPSLQVVEPTEAINLVEVVLRDLVRLVLGDAWTQSRRVDLSALEAKRAEDKAKRRGTAVNEDLLAYTEFIQLQQIILDDWDKFTPALGKQKYIAAYFDRLNAFRNPAMHSRPLREFERDLVNGIVGELRNLVVIYRTERGPDMEYYPKIEQVTDSFGNNPSRGSGDLEIRARLKVGDIVTFSCRAWDSQDRDITWQLAEGIGNHNILAVAAGSEVTLEFKVTREIVQERMLARITITSDGQYHRYLYWDDSCDFYYAVDPPLE
jgi:hypothetical protein